MAEALIQEAGCDPNAPAPGTCRTPLHAAALGGDEETLGMLMRAAGRALDPSAQDKDGNTALHLAAGAGAVGVARLLLSEAGAPLLAFNGHEETPLWVAARAGHLEASGRGGRSKRTGLSKRALLLRNRGRGARRCSRTNQCLGLLLTSRWPSCS